MAKLSAGIEGGGGEGKGRVEVCGYEGVGLRGGEGERGEDEMIVKVREKL